MLHILAISPLPPTLLCLHVFIGLLGLIELRVVIYLCDSTYIQIYQVWLMGRIPPVGLFLGPVGDEVLRVSKTAFANFLVPRLHHST